MPGLDLIGRNDFVIPAYVDNFSGVWKLIRQMRNDIEAKNPGISRADIDTKVAEYLNTPAKKMVNHSPAHFVGYAAKHPGVLLELYGLGVDLFAKDQNGRRPLNVIANGAQPKVVEFMLELHEDNQISTTELDDDLRSAIHHLCMFGSSAGEKASVKDMAESLKLLLAKYPDAAARKNALEQKDAHDLNPAEYAISLDYMTAELKIVFEENGVDLPSYTMQVGGIQFQRSDFFNRTKLMLNSFAGGNEAEQLKAVQEALDAGEYPNQPNELFGGRCATILVASNFANPISVWRAVLEHPKTDFSVTDYYGTNLLMYAANTANPNLLSMVLDGVTLADGTVRKFPIEDLNEQDKDGYSALHAAALVGGRPSGRAQTINKLIMLGIDTELKDASGKTALQMAEERGLAGVVKAINEAIAAKVSAAAEEAAIQKVLDAARPGVVSAFDTALRALPPLAQLAAGFTVTGGADATVAANAPVDAAQAEEVEKMKKSFGM